MRSSDPPRQDAGYVATLALLAVASIMLIWLVSSMARRSVENELMQQQLETRLERELAREVKRLYDQARASGAVPDRRRIEAQAFINLHARGRREMLELEHRRQEMKQLVANRIDAREQLERLGLAVRRAQMWVMMLERRLEAMPQVRRKPSAIAVGGAASPARAA